jgi:hypothetical protein
MNTCRCSWSSPPMSSLVRGLSLSYPTRNSEPSGLSNDEFRLNEDVTIDCVSIIERSSGASVESVTTASSSGHHRSRASINGIHKKQNKKSRYAPGDWVLARRPAGSLLLTAARCVPYAWRLFRGAAEATAYAAPRLRFSPGCRDKSCTGSDGGREESSVRSRAARIRDFEGPDSAIVGEARKERPRRFGVSCRVLSIQTRPWRGFPTLPLLPLPLLEMET